MENSIDRPKKIKNRTTIQSISSASRYSSEENKKQEFQKVYEFMFIGALLIVTKIWKQP